MTQDRPNCLQQSPTDHSRPELTDAQRGFAEVVGRELARTWIEQQAVTSTTNHPGTPLGTSHEKP